MKIKYNVFFYLLVCIVFLLLALIAFVMYKKKSIKKGLTTNKDYLDGIDVIYWINLDRSPERRVQMETILETPAFNGIPNQRISAFDGKKNPKIIYSKLNIPSPKKQSDTEYACLLSHLEAIRTFNESNHETALIFEDDVTLEFKKYWTNTVSQIIENAPADWEILLLSYIYKGESNQFYTWEKNTDDYDRATNYYSGISYLINKRGSSKIMKTYHNGVYTLDKNTHHVADSHLYELTNSYAYKYPMFIYKTNNNSTIHMDHIPYHVKSKQRLLENYSNLIG